MFDPDLSDANGLLMAKSGGGKTLAAQQMLLMPRGESADLDFGARRLLPAIGGVDGRGDDRDVARFRANDQSLGSAQG